MRPFPESTCVECGQKMINGTVRRCPLTNEFCHWNIPKALGETASALLAALKKLPLDYFDKPEEDIDAADFVDCSNAFLAAMKAARAAIAKAEGGA